jgi:NAD(P)H-hydrate epimerase
MIETGYLNAKDAAALDAELMSSPGFSLEQLMELAGLAVAEAVYSVAGEDGRKNVLLVCG